MKTIFSNRFDGGIANDIYGGVVGEFSISKHFDILTYPNRLYPLRGMSPDMAGTGIGQIIIGSDNNFYGLGWASADHAGGNVWNKTGAATWTESTSYPADGLRYGLLVEYHNSSGVRQLFFSTSNNFIDIVNLDFSTASSHALSYTNIAQGFVHPKDDILYIPYDNKIASNNNGTWNDTALVLPANYRITSLSYYGDYLAIACTPSVNGVDYPGNSIVYLWNRDATLSTVDESIDWGSGNLKALNNLDGVLIGISDTGGGSSNNLDFDSIQIKAYAGATPQLIKEIPTIKQTTTAPDASINPRVNFINRGRMYFSINIDSGGSSPAYRGLWSLGKSKLTGRYAVTLERIATTDNSETGVLAAAIAGDKVCMVYDAEGTLSFTNTTASTGDQWTATSVFETVVNPDMPAADKPLMKQLMTFAVHYLPLPSTGQVVAKYRVDGGAWTTIFAETGDGAVATEMTVDASEAQFTSGRNYEFRIESTGFAQIVGYSYKYEAIETLI
jgi:hypothetical protein